MTIETLKEANKIYDELREVEKSIRKYKSILCARFQRATLHFEHVQYDDSDDWIEENVRINIDRTNIEMMEPVINEYINELERERKKIKKRLESL